MLMNESNDARPRTVTAMTYGKYLNETHSVDFTEYS